MGSEMCIRDSLYATVVRPCIVLAIEYLPFSGALRTRLGGSSSEASSDSAAASAGDGAAAAVFKLTASHPGFEFVESVVIDGHTGARLYGVDVTRGSVRLETLRFRVHQPLGLVRRKTTTAMRIMGMWQVVATERLELGEFAPVGHARIHEYAMPRAEIPTSPFAKGRFKTEVEYTCDGLPGVVLRREEDIEFSII